VKGLNKVQFLCKAELLINCYV